MPSSGASGSPHPTAGLKQPHMLKACCMTQVLVPGKQKLPPWLSPGALDYDPVKTVHDTLSGGCNEEPEEAGGHDSGSYGGEALPAELGAALLARRSLRMRKSQSLQDAVRVIQA